METITDNLHATTLAKRLQGVARDDFWLHLESEGPLEKYPAKQHARRVRDHLQVAEGLVYLPGAPARNNEDSDMPAPFRQRRYFYYLSGCPEPDCHLTYDIKRDILTLFIPRVNPARVIWNGRGSTPAEALDKYDIDQVFYADQLELWIKDWFQHYRYDASQRLFVLHKEQIPHSTSPWPVDSMSLQPAMNQCRMIKDEHEISLIRKANDISSKAHKQVLASVTDFTNEAQVEGLFLNVCVSHQAKQQAYDPIAASGPNAGTLHYDANNQDFGDRQLICLDAGCEFDLYASDITRTFPLSGSWPSKEAEHVYKLVERMQEACIQKLAPGVRYLDLHILAHQIAIDGLLKLGILHNGTREEIYKAGTSKAFFPHGLGHHVGLEVHDVGQRELMSLNMHCKYEKVPSLYPEDFHIPVYNEDLCMAPTHPQSPHLDEGMVVTVEPGIYFSAYALNHFYLPSPVHSKFINTKVLSKYFPVGGVRIEDNILVTSKGYENLTTAPKGDAMLTIIKSRNTETLSKPDTRHKETTEGILRHAPGIQRCVTDPVLKPIHRASTEPIPSVPNLRSEEKPAFQDHWLFSGLHAEASRTRNDPVGKVRRTDKRISDASPKDLLPLCGISSSNVEHAFMGWQNNSGSRTPSPTLANGANPDTMSKCQPCIVLFETVDRLKKTLQSTKTSTNLDEHNRENLPTADGVRRDLKGTRNRDSYREESRYSSSRRTPEMQQTSRFAAKVSVEELRNVNRTRAIHTEADVVHPGPVVSEHKQYGYSLEFRHPESASQRVSSLIPEKGRQAASKTPEAVGYQPNPEGRIHNEKDSTMPPIGQKREEHRSLVSKGYPNIYPQQRFSHHEATEAHIPSYPNTTASVSMQCKLSPQPRFATSPTDLRIAPLAPVEMPYRGPSSHMDRLTRGPLRNGSRPSLPSSRDISANDIPNKESHATLGSCNSVFVPFDPASMQYCFLRQETRSAPRPREDGYVPEPQLPPRHVHRDPSTYGSHNPCKSQQGDPTLAPAPRGQALEGADGQRNSPLVISRSRNMHVTRPGGEELSGIDYAGW